MMKREALPALSGVGEQALASYAHALREEEDLAGASIRNYLSDLRHFAAWCEARWLAGQEYEPPFTPTTVTTPTLTQYRAYLQHVLHLKPASVNRTLISVKRYFAWLLATGQIIHDPAKVVKLVDEERAAPRQVNDQEEQALVAAVTAQGTLRDRAIIVLLLHTGLRARELCTLTRSNVRLGKRSGALRVLGKGNKYREIPLNATARAVLEAYDPTLRRPSQEVLPLFPSQRRQMPLTERGLGYLVKKYAASARLEDVSPHDLRHRFGYRMAAQVPLHRLAQLMGHDSLDTTLRYVQATQADLQHDGVVSDGVAWGGASVSPPAHELPPRPEAPPDGLWHYQPLSHPGISGTPPGPGATALAPRKSALLAAGCHSGRRSVSGPQRGSPIGAGGSQQCGSRPLRFLRGR